MNSLVKKMDTVFYLTILAGLLTVLLSGVTYYKGKQKEIEAEKSNEELLKKTNQVVDLQNNLLVAMNKTQEKSDAIISLQNKLQEANSQILKYSNENIKQVLGSGAPSLSATFYPDKLITLFIENNNPYPIYDLNINFPNPDNYTITKKMAEANRLLSWEEMRNQWITIPSFNLPANSTKSFYSFYLPESMNLAVCFLNIVSRNGAYSGKIVIKRVDKGFTFETEVRNSSPQKK